jgi:tetratricopeptide (TPR) repeat protein
MRRGHDEYPGAATDRGRDVRFWEFIAPTRHRLLSVVVSLKMMTMNVQNSIDRAYKHSCRGEYDRAISEYDEILRREPENAFALYKREYCRYVRREFDEALNDFLLAMRAGPRLLDEYSRYICNLVDEVDLDVDSESLLHEYPLFRAC